ncbi:integral peroxisomal membrane peroxin-domain-containing protein [Pisolithus tinctorius]|nr:integral peroxisomal membrane peroxin-domain-containing protein [Pisolithus tinctorius]
MSTFEYVDIPAEAIRLAPSSQGEHSVRPAPKIPTTFPDPSSASGFFSWHSYVDSSSPENDATPLGLSKTSLSIIPQILLSTSVPTASTSAATSAPSNTGLSLFTTSPRSGQTSQKLLSARDPLSLPIMTNNFRRFVAKVGPVFWLQDRIEEIILWKRGWKRTAVWLAVYGFICYYPKFILLLPHVLLLGIMLAYYPAPGSPPIPLNISEGTVDWQANIQAIQNLMGAFPETEPAATLNSSLEQKINGAQVQSTVQISSYPPHPTLMLTLTSFLILLPVVMADILPMRLLFFFLGVGPVCALHPNVRNALTGAWVARHAVLSSNVLFSVSIPFPTLPRPHLPLYFRYGGNRRSPTHQKRYLHFQVTRKNVRAALRRFVDNDRLLDQVWPAPMCTVELWENERGGEGEIESGGVKSKSSILPVGSWSKTHLRQSERAPWTRGRDGWSGVGGEIRYLMLWYPSSNLTFSLSPGWAFVETESWRADLEGCWVLEGQHLSNEHSNVEADHGWVYTNDTWSNPRPDPCPAEGWVTRRRRWIRRVYWKGL